MTAGERAILSWLHVHATAEKDSKIRDALIAAHQVVLQIIERRNDPGTGHRDAQHG